MALKINFSIIGQRWFRLLLVFVTMFFAATVYALSIQHVELVNDVIDASLKQPAKVRFALTEPASVQLNIYDARDYLIYASKSKLMNKGVHSITWDGRGTQGNRVPSEAYSFTLEANNKNDRVEYDMTDYSGGERVNHVAGQWSSEKGVINLTLSEHARVNVRIGLDQGPVLRTLLDWVPRRAGSYPLVWDGYDSNQTIDLTHHPKLKIVVDAFSLPQNTIYVEPDKTDGTLYNQPHFIVVDDNAVQRRQKKKPLKPLNRHPIADRSAAVRHDYAVSLAVGKPQSNSLPIKIDVDEANRKTLYSSRFELAVFIDGLYHYENEVAFLPMTYQLNTKKLTKGEHYLTVNIMSYDGNFGFATHKITVY